MSIHSISQFTESDAVRFWASVQRNGPFPDRYRYPNIAGTRCWRWTKAHDRKGYGIFTLFMGEVHRNAIASRVAYILSTGDIRPKDACVLHHCDNRGCLNPAHFFLGTRKDNMQDCLSKDRYPTGNLHYCKRTPEKIMRGEGRWNCKLTPEKVRMIRVRSEAGEMNITIAEEFGLNDSTVSQIVHRKRWAHVL